MSGSFEIKSGSINELMDNANEAEKSDPSIKSVRKDLQAFLSGL